MSKENLNDNPKTEDEYLFDFNFLGLWSQCGADWSSSIKDEIQSTINQPNETKESQPTNQVVLLGVLAILALLSAAIWIPVSPIYQAGKESDVPSIELLRAY